MAWIEVTRQGIKSFVNTDQIVRIAPLGPAYGGGCRLYSVGGEPGNNKGEAYVTVEEDLAQIESILARMHITVGR